MIQERSKSAIDVAYLLQRIERLNGLVILVTNLRDHIEAPFSSAAKHRWRAVRFPLLSQ